MSDFVFSVASVLCCSNASLTNPAALSCSETKATEESRDDMVLWLEEALDAHDDSPDKRIDNGETKIMNDTVEVNTENVEVPTILQDLDSAKKAYDDSFQFFKNDDARVDKESEDRFKALTIEVKEKGNFISSLIAKNKEQDLRIDGLMKLNSEKGDGIETLITKCAETEEKLSKSDQDKTLMAHQLTMMTEKYDGLSFDFKKEEEKNSILSVKLKGLEYKLFSLTGENNMLVQEKEAWVHDHLKTQEIIVQLREELYESKHEASVVVAQCSDQCFENDELIKQNDELKKLLAEAQDQLRMQREQEAIKPTVDKDGGTDSIVTEEFEVPVTFERQVVFERICSPASFVDTPVYADDEGKLSKRSGFLACIFPGMA